MKPRLVQKTYALESRKSGFKSLSIPGWTGSLPISCGLFFVSHLENENIISPTAQSWELLDAWDDAEKATSTVLDTTGAQQIILLSSHLITCNVCFSHLHQGATYLWIHP